MIHASFDPAFARLIERLEQRFGGLPPTFAFIDPFGAATFRWRSPRLFLRCRSARCSSTSPTSYLARFGDWPEFAATMDSLFPGERWQPAFEGSVRFEPRMRMLLDRFMEQMRTRVPYVRAFEITPAHEAGGNTYHLVFGTANAEQGLRKMKDAMWRVDPTGGERFRDTTLATRCCSRRSRRLTSLEQMLRERFGGAWFTIEQAERFTLIETPFRDNGHLERPTLAPAERLGASEVRRAVGQKAGSLPAARGCGSRDVRVRPRPWRTYVRCLAGTSSACSKSVRPLPASGELPERVTWRPLARSNGQMRRGTSGWVASG